MIGVGCPRMLYAEVVSRLYEWARASKQYDVVLNFEQTPNRMDWSYSKVFQQFLESPAEFLVLNDADVLPELPFDQNALYYRRNLDSGYTVTGSPTMSTDGGFNWGTVGLPDGDMPFEVSWVTGGHWWIARRVIETLKPVAFLETEKGRKEPLFFRIPDTYTEDRELCRLFVEAGARICVDPRLRTRHYKLQGLPSYRAGLEVKQP